MASLRSINSALASRVLRTPAKPGLAIALVALTPTIAHAGDTTSTPAPGISLTARTTTGPNERIFIAKTELCHQGIRIEARSAQASRITPEAWGTAMGAKLAVNGDFWRTDTSKPIVYGDAVGLGVRWPIAQTGRDPAYAGDWYHDHYGWIAFGPDWAEFDHTGYVKDHATALGITQGFHGGAKTTAIPPGTQALVSGFPELVVEGTLVTAFPDRGDCSLLEPRTAMGLSADRKTFYLVTVDGRSTSSVGMTCAQLAKLMQSIGAYTAFNLDGGGSTQMFVAGRGTINQPSDESPRAVANDWGVFADGAVPAKSCFTPGACFPSAIPEAAGARFGDLPDADPIAPLAALAVDRGYVAPCQSEPAMFCPNCGIARRAAIALVVAVAGLDVTHPPATPTFSDVPADAADYAAIEAANAAGLVTACSAGKLCPDEVATRGEVAALIARARGWSATSAPALADVPGEHPFHDEIEAVAQYCAASTCKASAFCPDEPATRSAALGLTGAAFALPGTTACDGPGDPGGGGDDDGGSHGGCGATGSASSLGLVGLGWLITRRRRSR